MAGKLVIVRGTNAGTTYDIADAATIGRAEECAVQSLDVQASREHCTITRDAAGWSIRDLDSSNGTFLNKVRITTQKLNSGDLIRIGETIYKFTIEPGEAKPQPAPARGPKLFTPASLQPTPPGNQPAVGKQALKAGQIDLNGEGAMTPEEAAALIDSLIPQIESKLAKDAVNHAKFAPPSHPAVVVGSGNSEKLPEVPKTGSSAKKDNSDTQKIAVPVDAICGQCGRKITEADAGIAVHLGGTWYCGHCDEWKF